MATMDPIKLMDSIKLELDPSIGTAGNVWGGTRTSLCLLKALEAHWGTLVGKKILSLGAGAGLLEIILGHMGAIVVATDIESVIPLLQKNIQLNSHICGSNVSAVSLDWCSPLSIEMTNLFPFDFIIASDVVYWKSLFEPFISM